ncbi:MAG: hypothetical protein PXY39_12615 [archaeon]|nr:hypothetical protein [archaeon]
MVKKTSSILWIVLSVILIVAPLALFLTFAFDPFLYCYGGGVEHVTTTLSNGSTTTLTLGSLPVCGFPPDFLIPFFGVLVMGIVLLGLGIIVRSRLQK